MTLEPLLHAGLAIKLHVATVVPAAVLGAYLLLRPKGTALHRLLGKIWLGLMVATAVSSFFIHTIRLVGPFSPIHLLSFYVIFAALRAIQAARRHDIRGHRRHVLGMYVGGIVVAGGFTLIPGRLMNTVMFSGSLAAWPLGLAILLAAVLLLWPVWQKQLSR
ncbi:DUF2306 domain-containing protein [Rhizobium sp. PAMB 3174]